VLISLVASDEDSLVWMILRIELWRRVNTLMSRGLNALRPSAGRLLGGTPVCGNHRKEIEIEKN